MPMDNITNFRILSPVPIDNRFVFDTYDGMVAYFVAHPSWLYEGLISYAKDQKQVYVNSDNSWKKINTDDVIVYRNALTRDGNNVDIKVDGSTIKINESNQLEVIFNDHFLGFFAEPEDLPTVDVEAGDYAFIDSIIWVWDLDTSAWVDTGVVGSGVISIITANGGQEAGHVTITPEKIGAMRADAEIPMDTDDIDNVSSVSGNTLSDALEYIASHSTWGGISGTLNSQTDLKEALDGKVPTSRTINGQNLSSDITIDIPESSTDLTDASNIMLKSRYDGNDDGIINEADVASSLKGVEDIPINKFYGKNSTGDVGFHTVEAIIGAIHWGSILGDMREQPDLIQALNEKVPESRTINGLSLSTDIVLPLPSYLHELTSDEFHRTITDEERTLWNSKQNAIGYVPEDKANKGVPGGYAPIDMFTGKIPANFVPAMTVNNVTVATSFPVSDLHTGDVCIRTDESKTYIYDGDTWQEMPVPTGNFVETVNGKIGPAVSIDKNDLGLSEVTNHKQAIAAESSIAEQIVTWQSNDGRTLNSHGYTVVYDITNDPSHERVPTELAVFAAINSLGGVSAISTKYGGQETGNVQVTPEKIGAMSENAAVGDMFKFNYDADNDGIVNAADVANSVSGVNLAGPLQFYGKDKNGAVGFHTINLSADQEVDWNNIINAPTFANIAYTGLYDDLVEKPVIPTELKDLTGDIDHRTVTDQQITNWDSKSTGFDYTPEDIASKGVPNGYAPLDIDGYIPDEYIRLTNVSWTDITGKPVFAEVGYSGDYADLLNTPIIPDELKDLIGDAEHRTVSDTQITVWQGKQNALGYTPLDVASKNVPGGYAGLDSNGKIETSYLPAITIVNVNVGTTTPTEGMVTGDIFINTTTGKTYIYDGSTWQEMLTTPSVTSVNGKFGVVEISKSDIGLGNVTDDKQVKANSSAVVGSIPTWESDSELSNGYALSTIIGEDSSDSKIPTEKAVQTYVFNSIQNIEPLPTTVTIGMEFPSEPISGDFCMRTDSNLTYIFDGANWQVLVFDSDFIKSVNGHIGQHVTVTKSDIGLSNVTDDKQLKSGNNAVVGNIPVWKSDNELESTGYSVNNVLDVTADDKIPTSKAVYDAIVEFAPQTCVTNQLSQFSSCAVQSDTVYTALNNKVDKVTGKGLSDENFTLEEKEKLAGVIPNAEPNVQADWYQTDDTSDDFIKNKPTRVSSELDGLLPAYGNNVKKHPRVKEDGSGIEYVDVELDAAHIEFDDTDAHIGTDNIQGAIDYLVQNKVNKELPHRYGWIGNESGIAEAMQVATVPPWEVGKVMQSTGIPGVFQWVNTGSGDGESGDYVGFYADPSALPVENINDGSYAMVGSNSIPYSIYAYNGNESQWNNTGGVGDEIDKYLRRDGANVILDNISWNGKKITNLGIPTDNSDATNKKYVDDSINGNYWKSPVEKVVGTLPAAMASGLRVAAGNGKIYQSNGTAWVELFSSREGNVVYSKEVKDTYLWIGNAWVKQASTNGLGKALTSDGTVPLVDNWTVNVGENTFRFTNYPGAVNWTDVTNKRNILDLIKDQSFGNVVNEIESPSNIINIVGKSVGYRYIEMNDQTIKEKYQNTGNDTNDWITVEPVKGMVVYSSDSDAYFWFNGLTWERWEYSIDAGIFNFDNLNLPHSQITNSEEGDPHTQYLDIAASRSLTGHLNVGNHRITGVSDGINDTDVPNMAQFRLMAAGVQWPHAAVVGFYNTPPNGTAIPRVVVGTEPSGVFATHANEIAAYNIGNSTWTYTVPNESEGILCTSNGEEINSVNLNYANEQYIFNGTGWILYFSGMQHDNLGDAANSTVHQKYLRNDLPLNLTNAITFTPGSLSYPFVVPTSKNAVVPNLNAEMTDGYHVSESESTDTIAARDGSGVIHSSGNKIRQLNIWSLPGGMGPGSYGGTDALFTVSGSCGGEGITNTQLNIYPSGANGSKTIAISGYDSILFSGSEIIRENSAKWNNYVTKVSFPVDITGITENQVITWDGSKFVPTAHNEVSSLTHHMLTDIDAVDDHLQYYNESRLNTYHNTVNVHALGTVVPHDALSNLTDVTVATPEANQVLKFSNGKWINSFVDYSQMAINHDGIQNVANSTSHLKYPLLDGTRTFTGSVSIGNLYGVDGERNNYLNMYVELGQFSKVQAVNHGSWSFSQLHGWQYGGSHEFLIINNANEFSFGNVDGSFNGFRIKVNSGTAFSGNLSTNNLAFNNFKVYHTGCDRLADSAPTQAPEVGGAIIGLNAQYIQGKTLDDISQGGSIKHSSLRELYAMEGSGTITDDHPQYLNVSRHGNPLLHDFYDEVSGEGTIPHDYIDGLQDVDLNETTLATGHVLKYNATTGKWSNGTVSSTVDISAVLEQTDTRYIRSDVNTTVSNKLHFNGTALNIGTEQDPVFVNVPFTVASGLYKAINFNADLLDGHHASDFIALSSNNTYTGTNTFNAAVTIASKLLLPVKNASTDNNEVFIADTGFLSYRYNNQTYTLATRSVGGDGTTTSSFSIDSEASSYVKLINDEGSLLVADKLGNPTNVECKDIYSNDNRVIYTSGATSYLDNITFDGGDLSA